MSMRAYDGTGRYELRDGDGELLLLGDCDACLERLEQQLDALAGLREATIGDGLGWCGYTILPAPRGGEGG